MYKVVLLFVIVLTALNNGCIIPFPHCKLTCESIEGYVVDQETKTPAENAKVTVYYPDGDSREMNTDAQGRFYFKEKHRFHWGILIWINAIVSLPLDWCWSDFEIITMEKDQYVPICFYPDRGFWSLQELLPREYPEQFVLVSIKQPDYIIFCPLLKEANWLYPEIPLTPLAESSEISLAPP